MPFIERDRSDRGRVRLRMTTRRTPAHARSVLRSLAAAIGCCLAPLGLPGLTVFAQDVSAAHGTSEESGSSVAAEAMESRCTRMVSPRYPAGIAAGTQEVILRVLIDRNGQVHPRYLISGRNDFENEAMDAVRTWRYRPMIRDYQPIAVSADIRVRFTPGVPPGLITHPSR